MPVFSPAQMSDQEMSAIAHYVQYLHQPSNPGGLGISHFGPVAEGFVGVIFGFGILWFAVRMIGNQRMTTTDRPGPPWPGAARSRPLQRRRVRRRGRRGRPSGAAASIPATSASTPASRGPTTCPGQDDTHWRYENDPKGARRAELRIAFCWTLTLLASIGLAAVYVAGGQAQVEGACWAVAFLGLGIGFILWARDLLPGNEVTASRGHHDVSAEADRRAVDRVADPGHRAHGPPALPVQDARRGRSASSGWPSSSRFASLGPRPGVDLYQTKWRKGSRATTVDGNPVRPGDIAVNGILTVFPDGDTSDDALSPTLLINVGDAPFEIPPSRVGWNIGGLVAFSKICTHAGCPACPVQRVRPTSSSAPATNRPSTC